MAVMTSVKLCNPYLGSFKIYKKKTDNSKTIPNQIINCTNLFSYRVKSPMRLILKTKSLVDLQSQILTNILILHIHKYNKI